MLVRRYLALVLVAGCSFDPSANSGSIDAAMNDAAARPDAAGPLADAAPPADAPAEVECSSAADCVVPPDPCHRPGVCNLTLGVCQYAPIDCSDLDDACNLGVCNIESGACEPLPSFEGTTCAPSTYGSYTACVFAGVCDLAGTHTRQRTDYTCEGGTCASATSTEEDGCTRPPGDVVGDTCGEDECASTCTCVYMGTCDTTGGCVRACTAYQCTVTGECAGFPYGSPEDCSRDTDGLDCFSCGEATGCLCVGGACTKPGGGG